MKSKLLIISVVSAVSVLALPGLAEVTASTQTNSADSIQANASHNSQTNSAANTQTNRADNTARNVRDRDNRTLTPLNQGNSVADVRTTAEIRKGIIAEKKMSVDARNVKIITNQGKVTLRGPVNTTEEKRLIGEIANRIARAENVDNQLEVKLTTSSNN